MPRSVGRKQTEENRSDNAGGLRWLLTYSDMITLLLALFIVLYALSATEAAKFEALSIALAKEFDANNPIGSAPGPSIISGQSGTAVPTALSLPETRTLQNLIKKLQAAVDRAHLQSEVTITLNPAGVRVSLEADLLFPSALASLNPRAVTLLQKIGQILNTVPNAIEVIGDTDSTPIHTALYPSNWQLGAMRAANVTDILAQIINPTRLIQVSFSKYKPIATNTTAAGRTQNRRVDLLVLTPALGEVFEDTGSIAALPAVTSSTPLHSPTPRPQTLVPPLIPPP